MPIIADFLSFHIEAIPLGSDDVDAQVIFFVKRYQLRRQEYSSADEICEV